MSSRAVSPHPATVAIRSRERPPLRVRSGRPDGGRQTATSSLPSKVTVRRLVTVTLALVDELLDELAGDGAPADLHEVVSFPLPALVICELLGVPYADRDDFRRWSDEAADMTDQARSFGGLTALWQYISGLMAAKLDDPGDDVLSALVAEHRADRDGFSLDQAAQLGAGLLFAGHETTVTAIDTGVVLLATHPEQRNALRHDPSLVPTAVEEILRASLPSLQAPAGSGRGHGLPRWANADLDVDGVIIAAGDLVLLGLHQANHDERLVGDRTEVDLCRRRNPHLTFGHGPHFCIGAPLARLELQVLFGTLLDRFPTLTVAVPVEQLQPRTDLLTGGLAALPVTW
ncbi:MAG: cytochrome P450 [Actinomycetota bacterium]|nr:cytochrome P450 [Actinomycetota bacterium]